MRNTSLSGRSLLADALLGFGAWHIVDDVISHWILGIDRIRMDSPDPLMRGVLDTRRAKPSRLYAYARWR
jgi:hypothetical protein